MSSAIQETQVSPVVARDGGDARSLAISELISHFGSQLREVLKFSSFEYASLNTLERQLIGHRQAHTCSYRIFPGGDDCLGEITLSRATPFRESELQVVEALLADLCLQLCNISDPDS